MDLLATMYNAQRELSAAQVTPIVGPLLVSPCKALVSAAQAIIGLAGAILFATLTVVSSSDWSTRLFVDATQQVALGIAAFGYSVMNMVTLGFAGYKLEQLLAEESTTLRSELI